jgi:DNA-binding CsgD family transcriptional regulator
MTRNINIDAKGRQMLELLAQGASARVVAKKMGYSEGTTRVYLHNLYRVLGVRNKTEAVIWLLNRRHQGEVAAVSPPPPPPASCLEESPAELAAREGLASMLGAMATFVGPYSRSWEAQATHKGATVDAKVQDRRAQARMLWNALLRGDFALAKAMHDDGHLDELAYRAPAEAMLVALLLLLGGYSRAGEALVAHLEGRRKATAGLNAKESQLLRAAVQAIDGDEDGAVTPLFHQAGESGVPALKHVAMATLFHVYRARRDAQRAGQTALALWAEADAVRKELEASGVRPLPRDAAVPRPGKLAVK